MRSAPMSLVIAALLVCGGCGGAMAGQATSPPSQGGSPHPGLASTPTATADPCAVPTNPPGVSGTTGGVLPVGCGQTDDLDVTRDPEALVTSRAERAAHMATARVEAFIGAIEEVDYATAWVWLSPDTQAHFGTFDAFVSDQTAFMESARNEAIVSTATRDPDQLALWLPGLEGIDVESAYVVEVHYPALASTNNELGVVIVAKDDAGAWRIWKAR